MRMAAKEMGTGGSESHERRLHFSLWAWGQEW